MGIVLDTYPKGYIGTQIALQNYYNDKTSDKKQKRMIAQRIRTTHKSPKNLIPWRKREQKGRVHTHIERKKRKGGQIAGLIELGELS